MVDSFHIMLDMAVALDELALKGVDLYAGQRGYLNQPPERRGWKMGLRASELVKHFHVDPWHSLIGQSESGDDVHG